MLYGYFYRALMKLAHKFNWHYMPPCYPEDDTMYWCHWCGIRDVVKREIYGMKLVVDPAISDHSFYIKKS